LIAVLDLLWHVDTLDGLILTSPVVALRPMSLPMKVLQRCMFMVAPHTSLNLPSDKHQVCSDPMRVQAYWDDSLCHQYVSAAFARALQEGREEILPFGQELDRPILLLEAGDDTVADPDGAEGLWTAVKPGLLERHRLEGFKHEILHDLRRIEAQAIAEVWLQRLLTQWRGNPKALAAMFVIEPKESP
jgi:alpha-beta hydrolase superfamily lysophospholipase